VSTLFRLLKKYAFYILGKMATKQDAPLEDEVCRKKPKIFKKLRPTAITEFLKRWNEYTLNSGQNNDNLRACQIRGILINKAYLNRSSQFNGNYSHLYLFISSTEFSIYIPSGYNITFDWNNYQPIVSIMRLLKFKCLSLVLSTQEINTSTRVSIFIRLFKAIKGIFFKYFAITTYF
jgi:hypothetical protein